MSSLWLSKHRRNIFSQSGDDGVLEAIFSRIGEGKKWCCEFGAWDGKWLSNTYNWILNHGWASVQIESQLDRFMALKSNMEIFPNVYAIHTFVEAEGEKRLDAILGQTPIPQDFDLLSVDVDGPDYLIWKGVTHYRPRVVIIETATSSLDAEIIGEGETGTSITPMVALAKQKGYELASYTGNTIFVLKELADKLDIDADNWRELCGEKFRHPDEGMQADRNWNATT